MRGDLRRRSVATWAVWGSAFLAVALLMAWKFQWFGGSDPMVLESGSETAGDETTLSDGAGQAAADSNPSSADVFDGQAEPGAGSGTDLTIPERFGSQALRKKLSNNPWDGPTDQPPGETQSRNEIRFAGRTASQPSTASAGSESSRYSRTQPDVSQPYRLKGTVSTAGYESGQPRGQLNGAASARTGNQYAANPVRQTGYETPGRLPAAGGATPDAGKVVAHRPVITGPPPVFLAKIDQLYQRGAVLDAHKELSNAYWQKPEWRSKAFMDRIQKTAEIIYFSPRRHFLKPYRVRPNEYLRDIAARYQVPYQYLERLNRVKGERMRAGQELKVIRGPFAVVVDLSERKLTVHHSGWFVAQFDVGIGRDRRSPRGKFQVEDKMENAPYTNFEATRPEDRRIPGGDPRNPLGSHWIKFDGSFGIHGTNDRSSIGKAASKGCIRMYNEDVAWVYDMLIPGAEILIQD